MRTALAILMMLAVAAALALFAGDNQGTITLFWPPHRIDLSLNLFFLVLVAAFALIHFSLRGISALLAIPHQARRWRTAQRERAMFTALFEALSHLIAGRFIRARKSAELALTYGEQLNQASEKPGQGGRIRALAHLLAAESAHALQDKDARTTHFRQALEGSTPRDAQEEREGVHLRAARWAMDDRAPVDTLRWLGEMPQGAARRTVALRLRLKAARQAGQTDMALETARLLDKHKAFSAGSGSAIVQSLTLELLTATRDAAQLQTAWSRLEPKERLNPAVAIAASGHLLEVGGDADLSRQWLLPIWEHMVAQEAVKGLRQETMVIDQKIGLLNVLERGFAKSGGVPDAVWLTRIESAQMNRPGDPLLQYLAGITCMHLQLWGKAQQLLRQSLPKLTNTPLERSAWLALARLADQRNDPAAATAAYRQAAGGAE
jgi:HemY protein